MVLGVGKDINDSLAALYIGYDFGAAKRAVTDANPPIRDPARTHVIDEVRPRPDRFWCASIKTDFVPRWSALENNPRCGAPFLDSQSVDGGEWRRCP
jgi:hypothetical protein